MSGTECAPAAPTRVLSMTGRLGSVMPEEDIDSEICSIFSPAEQQSQTASLGYSKNNMPMGLSVPCQSLFPSTVSKESAGVKNQAVFHVEGMQGLNQGVGGYYGMQQAGSRSNSAGISSTTTGSGASAGVGLPPNARNVPGHLPGYSGLWDPSRQQQQAGGGEDPVHLSPPQALNLLQSQHMATSQQATPSMPSYATHDMQRGLGVDPMPHGVGLGDTNNTGHSNVRRPMSGNLTPGPASSKAFFQGPPGMGGPASNPSLRTESLSTTTEASGHGDRALGLSEEATQHPQIEQEGDRGLYSAAASTSGAHPPRPLLNVMSAEEMALQQLASPDAFMRYGFTLEGALAAQQEAEQQQQQQQQEEAAPRNPRMLSAVDTQWSQATQTREAFMSPHSMQVRRMLESLNVDGDFDDHPPAPPQPQQQQLYQQQYPNRGGHVDATWQAQQGAHAYPPSNTSLAFASHPMAPPPAPANLTTTAPPQGFQNQGYYPPQQQQQQQQPQQRTQSAAININHPHMPPQPHGYHHPPPQQQQQQQRMAMQMQQQQQQQQMYGGPDPSQSRAPPSGPSGPSAKALAELLSRYQEVYQNQGPSGTQGGNMEGPMAAFDSLRQQLGREDAMALLLHLQRQQMQHQQQQQQQQQQFHREVLLQLQQQASQQQQQQQHQTATSALAASLRSYAASQQQQQQVDSQYPRHHHGQHQHTTRVPPHHRPSSLGPNGAAFRHPYEVERRVPPHHQQHRERQASGSSVYVPPHLSSSAARLAALANATALQQQLHAQQTYQRLHERSQSDGPPSHHPPPSSNWFTDQTPSLTRAQSTGGAGWPSTQPSKPLNINHPNGRPPSYLDELALMGLLPGSRGGEAGMGKFDAMAAKRAELLESPTTRMQFKDFYRQFRSKERCSFQAAKDYAMACFEHLPKKVHWKLYLEMADLAKRENRIEEARRLYKKVCRLQPHASQGWLEYSKMEEECGDMDVAARILKRGLVFCEFSESLLARAIKHEERKKNIAGARELLARLKHVGIDKVWRTVLEGALLEARAGNNAVARKVFKYLMSHVPWYGPIYNEAFRLEEKCEHHATALAIVERGLKEIPRYGPLWFGAFRLCERLDLQGSQEQVRQGRMPSLVRTREAISRALSSISKELIWKVHFEAAQIEERAASLAALHRAAQQQQNLLKLAQANKSGDKTDGSDPLSSTPPSHAVAAIRHELLGRCRRCYVEAVLSSPSNLRWKVWLAGARTELGTGRLEVARSLLHRAFQEVPDKSRAHVFLECSRLEEFCGHVDRARRILVRSRQETRAEWKVFLESVLLEMRAGKWDRAVEEAQSALKIHTGTGRLWAILVQLRYMDGDVEQVTVLRQALREVPKSGEVWCEGARIHLSPLSRCFDLDTAEQYLDFAIQFTPQYGDSFLELLRLVLIREVIVPRAQRLLAADKAPRVPTKDKDSSVASPDPSEGVLEEKDNDVAHSLATQGVVDFGDLEQRAKALGVDVPDVHAFLDTDTAELELRCSNADPNYGMMWFHCRDMPSDTPRLLMRRAKLILSKDLAALYPLYLRAILRRLRVQAAMPVTKPVENATESEARREKEREADRTMSKELTQALREADAITPSADLHLQQWDFVTGLVSLNRIASRISELPDEDKRKMLFGCDQLVP